MGKKKGQKKGGNLDDEWYDNPSSYFQVSFAILYRKDDGTVSTLLDQAEMTGKETKQKVADVGKGAKGKKNILETRLLGIFVF